MLASFGLVGCGSADTDGEHAEHKSFGLDAKALTIDARGTDLEVVPADVREVEVTRRVAGWVVLGSGPDARWDMRDGRLTLRVKCSAMISDCAGRHEVKVPRGVAVTVEADGGKVTASKFDTALRVRADNGEVTVSDCRGPLDLRSDNGAVRAEEISAPSVTARSDNGSIRLRFTRAPDLVDTVSGNGSTTVELPRDSGAYAVSATAENGRTSVRVPRDEDSAHVVKARGENGQVTVRSVN